ncbi:uncharacterized protein LACBIDRAFT_323096 [Laccaria bicolor S238N-H82]|uniref:Predicted protein n=1 Tax=Laccaria bicolor (strain S238N-H82 / ATCC MYA-4686) TaxID=486041 RepID=B0CW42_LACBS|nr:uncharacterized protein LACBIDRAFT_323096 [Laccaria bicolor S238N-H82]EDR13851.1 predicted protein [Laccaria bicolor S238N-H82]|eukprot:XP_001876349.1 predicted protein [Laccaria bicolor S238N-H82]
MPSETGGQLVVPEVDRYNRHVKMWAVGWRTSASCHFTRWPKRTGTTGLNGFAFTQPLPRQGVDALSSERAPKVRIPARNSLTCIIPAYISTPAAIQLNTVAKRNRQWALLTRKALLLFIFFAADVIAFHVLYGHWRRGAWDANGSRGRMKVRSWSYIKHSVTRSPIFAPRSYLEGSLLVHGARYTFGRDHLDSGYKKVEVAFRVAVCPYSLYTNNDEWLKCPQFTEFHTL